MRAHESHEREPTSTTDRNSVPSESERVEPPLVVGAAGDREEVEADRMAAAVMRATASSAPEPPTTSRIRRSAATGAFGRNGGEVDSQLTDRIRDRPGHPLDGRVRRSFESAFAADFRDVRIHAESDAAPRLGADAFTLGNDVHFAPGRFQPGTDAGDSLIAHELAHVVQNSSHVRRAMAPTTESTIIRRSLIGTYAVMHAVEGEKGFRLFKTHGSWTDALKAVQKYEEMEKKPATSGGIKKLEAQAKALRKQLTTIIKHCDSWLKHHEKQVLAMMDDNATKFGDTERLGDEAKIGLAKLTEIRKLRRRAVRERRQIGPHQLRTTRRDDQQLTGTTNQDNAVGGMASKLDRLTFADQTKNTTGYYQPDVRASDVTISAAAPTGIPAVDPNWSGRSIAAGRLDKLITGRLIELGAAAVLQAPSLVNMEFATHERMPHGGAQKEHSSGVFLEKADGVELRSGVLEDANRQMALDDPVLQQAMNKLQILDAICGQVDRHSANMYVQLDATGKVTGLQGIDNDMAFGQKLDASSDKEMRAFGGGISNDFIGEKRAWRGLPPIADEQVAAVILGLKEQDIRMAVDGLISPAEVDATVNRLKSTQAFLNSLPRTALITTQQWDADKAKLAKRQGKFNSYVGEVRTEALGHTMTATKFDIERVINTAMTERFDPPANNRAEPTQKPKDGEERAPGTVPEYVYGETEILGDVASIFSSGIDEQKAIGYGKEIAKIYAGAIRFPDVDRSKMKLKKALETVDGASCARALAHARKVVYSAAKLS